MKKLFCVLLIMMSFFTGNVFAASKVITLVVKGMVCSFCAQGIEKKFSAEPSVESINISLKDKKVILILKDGKDLSDDKIKKILTDAGYTVEKIVRN